MEYGVRSNWKWEMRNGEWGMGNEKREARLTAALIESLTDPLAFLLLLQLSCATRLLPGA